MLTAQLLSDAWKEVIPIIALKTWVIHPVSDSATLYLSDNPVVMHNEMQFGPRGNLGLAVEGIELYFPLSPTSCLAMYCPKTTAELERKYREMASCQDFVGHAQSPERREIVGKLFNAFRTGEPVPFDCSNVEFVNSLQVCSADRYVYAAHDDFVLAAQMVERIPRLRFGPRSSVA